MFILVTLLRWCLLGLFIPFPFNFLCIYLFVVYLFRYELMDYCYYWMSWNFITVVVYFDAQIISDLASRNPFELAFLTCLSFFEHFPSGTQKNVSSHSVTSLARFWNQSFLWRVLVILIGKLSLRINIGALGVHVAVGVWPLPGLLAGLG